MLKSTSIEETLSRNIRWQNSILAAWMLIAFWVTCSWAVEAAAQSRTEAIVASTQPAPDGNGNFLFVDQPSINRAGQVAFSGVLVGTTGGATDSSGRFLADGSNVFQIVRQAQLAPNGNGTFASLGPRPVLNDAGQIAFVASLNGTSGGSTDNVAIFTGNSTSLAQAVRRGQAAPDGNGAFLEFSNLRIGSSGQITFLGTVAGSSGGLSNTRIFRQNGNAILQLARRGQAAPGGGVFSDFNISNGTSAGEVAFVSSLLGTSGGTSDDQGMFRTAGSTIIQVARKGQTAPGGNGTLFTIGTPNVSPSNSGDVAFSSFLSGTSGGAADNQGLFKGNGGNLTQIARKGQLVQNGNGFYESFGAPTVNSAGQVSFFATLSGTSGGLTDNRGIFRASDDSITEIVRSGQAVPDGNGVFTSISSPTMNSAGQVVFFGNFAGAGQVSEGIFTSDGIDQLAVVRQGDPLVGATVDFVSFESDGVNDMGQVAYQAILNDRRFVIGRWTPDLKWRSSVGGSWEAANNWTLGLNPGQPHDVLLNPSASLTVTGPTTDRTIRSLQVGGGTGLARLVLGNGAVLTATQGVNIESTGTLAGDGVIAGNITNRGTILANNLIVDGLLNNQNILRGNGRIHADILNSASGRIRAVNGEELWLSGAKFHNAGFVDIHQAELRIDAHDFEQTSSGVMSLRNGTLIFGNNISNSGRLIVSQGPSSIQGTVHNTGTLQISGDASATFFGDLIQNGTLELATIGNTSSFVVALGSFSGNGGFSGGGDLFVLGDLQPGNSAASVLFDGNLFLGSTANTLIELGGLGLGQFDQLMVTGDVNLSGALSVSLINGHSLGLNQQYLIGDIGGSLTGQFLNLNEGSIVARFGEYDLFITYQANNGNGLALFTAVPEPSSAVAMLLAGAGFGLWQSRRRRLPANRQWI